MQLYIYKEHMVICNFTRSEYERIIDFIDDNIYLLVGDEIHIFYPSYDLLYLFTVHFCFDLIC